VDMAPKRKRAAKAVKKTVWDLNEEKAQELMKKNAHRPLDEVKENLMPVEVEVSTKLIEKRIEEDMFKFYHKQQLRPTPVETITNEVLGSVDETKGKWITFQYMEYNGAWHPYTAEVFVQPGKPFANKPNDFYITDLQGHEAKFELSEEKVGNAAFLITDVQNNPVHPQFQSFANGGKYILHVAPKHVRFQLKDGKGNIRNLLEVVVYGAPARELCLRVRVGLGISRDTPVLMERGDVAFPPEFKHFRFSKDPSNIDTVTVNCEKMHTFWQWHSEYPVQRIPPRSQVRSLPTPNEPAGI
jgi:hypothetical protein